MSDSLQPHGLQHARLPCSFTICLKDGDPGGGVPRLNLLCLSVYGFQVGEAHPPETDDVHSRE